MAFSQRVLPLAFLLLTISSPDSRAQNASVISPASATMAPNAMPMSPSNAMPPAFTPASMANPALPSSSTATPAPTQATKVTGQETLDYQLSEDIVKMMESAPSLDELQSSTTEEAQQDTGNASYREQNSDADKQKLILSTTRVEEMRAQLLKLSAEWENSLFFSKPDIQALQQALEWRQMVEERNPDILKRIEDLTAPNATQNKVAEAPVNYENFRLKSIVVDPKGGWTVYVNDRKITRKTKSSESNLIALSVNNRAVTFRWTPQDDRLLDLIVAAAEKTSIEDRKLLPAHNRIATLIPKRNITNAGDVIFTLRPNQSFASQYAAIYEGLPPPVTTQQTDTVDTPLIPSPEELMQRFPDSISAALNPLSANPLAGPSTPPINPAQTVYPGLNSLGGLTNSLSTIVDSNRSRAQQPTQ